METSMYSGEEEELRQAIEVGRRHKIAAEVWAAFMNSRREEIIRTFESSYGLSWDTMNEMAMELRLMQKFREVCNKMIQLGEIAEEKLSSLATD